MMPLWVFGQGKKANEYYKEGVSLYNTHRIEEALQCFKKSDALEKQEIDPQYPNYYRSEKMIASCWTVMAYLLPHHWHRVYARRQRQCVFVKIFCIPALVYSRIGYCISCWYKGGINIVFFIQKNSK